MGSDGTVYGWGVTNGTPPPGSNMTHMAYVTTTLTSLIKHRQVSPGQQSAYNTIREDVSLSFDAGDVGLYQVQSYSSIYCYAIMGYILANALSQGSASNAYPVNFAQVGSGADIGNGVLEFTYTWQSSSGNRADLSACVVYEVVTYGDGHSPFVWPNPPWNHSNNNPVVTDIPGTDGRFTDDQLNGGNIWVKPYKAATFSATQNYRYTCNGGSEVNLMGPMSIVRTVTQNANGTYKYQVTKSGASATLNPLP